MAPANDCVPCHFRWEEKHALPFLPPDERRIIWDEHEAIRKAGYPSREVIAHSQREMAVFERYVPPHLLAIIYDDHERFGPVLEAFALNDLRVPTSRIA